MQRLCNAKEAQKSPPEDVDLWKAHEYLVTESGIEPILFAVLTFVVKQSQFSYCFQLQFSHAKFNTKALNVKTRF